MMPRQTFPIRVPRFRQFVGSGWATFALTFGAVVLGVLLATVLFRETYIGVDDANITMVYARNLAAGHGFVYNIGGERVEGFTSLLYVLIMAGVFAVSSTPELHVLAVCVLLVTASVFFPLTAIRAFAQKRDGESAGVRPVELAMIAWAVGSAAFIVWTTVSLMDTALWAFMWSCAVSVVLWELGNSPSRRLRLGVMSAVALLFPLARPEGFAAAPACLVMYAFARRLHCTTWRDVAPAVLVPGAAFLLAVGSVTGFRLAYFGFPLPNTYYAKVSPSVVYRIQTGTEYFAQFVATQPLLMALVLGTIAAGILLNARLAGSVLRRGREAADPDSRQVALRAAQFTAGVLAVVGLLLPVYGGGDHFAGFRFYQPIWPTLILPMILLGLDLGPWLVRLAPANEQHRLAWAATIALLPLVPTLTDAPWPNQPQPDLLGEFQIAEDGRRLGEALNRLFPEAPPRVGVTAAGGVQYTYRGPVYDMLGLNDVRMGHSPGDRRGLRGHAAFDKTVFWTVAPPVVSPVLCGGPIDADLAAREFRKLSRGILQGLYTDAAFEHHYVLAAVHGTPFQRVFDKTPFFFLPHWLRHPRAPVDAYRDAKLVAFFAPDMIKRLEGRGWRVDTWSHRGRDSATLNASYVGGPCPPPQTRSPDDRAVP
jgi:arabinofuranosyltransferase